MLQNAWHGTNFLKTHVSDGDERKETGQIELAIRHSRFSPASLRLKGRSYLALPKAATALVSNGVRAILFVA